MDNVKLKEFLQLIDQLKPEARQDVLDYSVFLLWTQTHNPAPTRSILRGGWLWLIWKIKDLAARSKKIVCVLMVLPFLACSLANTATTQIPHKAAQLARIVTPATITCTVTAFETLNLRASPGTDTAVIAILNYGDVLTILPDPAQGNWVHVQTQNRNGWINSKYCGDQK